VVVDSRQENLIGRFGNYPGYVLIEKRLQAIVIVNRSLDINDVCTSRPIGLGS
jgi:hypothetical protein